MSNCCSCIRRCGTDAYQPLSSQRLGYGGSKIYWDGRESIRSPRNQRRKLSVRYDAVRPAGVARLDDDDDVHRSDDRDGNCTREFAKVGDCQFDGRELSV